ncbi:MAG: cytochrome B [Saprospiraceae bacterium]|nr:cytochrome B [Saprospiraceae bacterium]
MYNILQHTHSGFRWIVLILLVLSVVEIFIKWRRGKEYVKLDKLRSLGTMVAMHIQLLLGLILYFISPNVQFSGASMKDSMLRFFLVEHPLLMILAIVVVTIGYVRHKSHEASAKKFKTIFWYYLIALILVLIGIPWPFQDYGAGWY